MVFKRRHKLSWGRWLAEGVYPKSGWRRAISYIGYRLKRLPDTPHKIARGVGVGVYVSFTPFFGFHFLSAFLLALLFRGNVLAAILGTFFGNPLTFPFIATGSLTLGHFLVGSEVDPENHKSLIQLFSHASWDFWHNFKALFTDETADWSNLQGFLRGVFLPYLVGGTGPGIILGIVAYMLSRPLVAAYQKRRKGKMIKRWKERRAKLAKKADGADHSP